MTESFQKVKAYGQLPSDRFGHTMTYIAKGKAILIGGKECQIQDTTNSTGIYRFAEDIFSFEMLTKQWNSVKVQGTVPKPRAAHAAVSIKMNQIVIYGGETGGGSLASDDLYLLDLRSADDIGEWSVVPVVGITPGRRYGHTLTFTKQFLIIFGGSTGMEPINDCWCINVERKSFAWVKIECQSEQPMARVYHSASVCTNDIANETIIIFGGRSKDQQPMNDAWKLKRHADGRWDWIKVIYKLDIEQPKGRYQHTSLFFYTMLFIIGGKTGNLNEMLTINVFDTETSEWSKFKSIQRFKHASWLVDTNIFIYGGFGLSSPDIPNGAISKINLNNLLLPSKPLSNKFAQYQDALQSILTSQTSPRQRDSFRTQNYQIITQKPYIQKQAEQPFFNFSNYAIVAEEHNYQKAHNKKPMPPQIVQLNNIADLFLNRLLQPKTIINLSENNKFQFKAQDIILLCDQAEAIIKEQPILLKCNAPIKIFGDIYGQYSDLMKFFDLWGSPFLDGKDGDIEAFDYIFLGNFVDRGSHSLETICLLLALKVRYPDSIHLIRGNHEDEQVNSQFGFLEECARRLDEDPNSDDSAFARVNRLFEWLPLAAIIEGRVFCVHGGIGSQLQFAKEIENIKRPIEVIHEITNSEQQMVIDILWSDPTDSDADFGIQPNLSRDPNGDLNLVKFGPDRVINFLLKNYLQLIIRSHECVMDGFERFAGGQLITVSSTIDECGKHKNAGAILVVKKNLEIVPKLIDPKPQHYNNWIVNDDLLYDRSPKPPHWKNQGQKSCYK
ncbi:unnamed protein product [Paramecium octaurelia]|uniref:Serine/threonine-protein phosphatase n=1 Tax=Paramecium octaurelia TaxID=43137 RepID=A0A8S1T7X8_PAROT|nr:unnamed protein product [Paramecium octaurelia]